MKNKLLIIILLGISNYAFSQDNIFGTYSHIDDSKVEFLELKSDSTFWYCYGCSLKNSWDDDNSFGYWEVKDNSLLILNSTTPKIVTIYEDYDKKLNLLTINVFPSDFPNERHSFYNLFVITEKEDTLSFYKQLDKTTIRKKIKIKSFWIEDMTGLKYLPYEVISVNNNIFNVIFYKGRVFENENWVIVNENRLRPKGIDGKLQDYFLIKRE
jgi:hypothetical protein